MIGIWLFKAGVIILILLLTLCIGGLYKVFERTPDKDNGKGYIAFGIIFEVILLIILAIKIITG